MKMDNLGGIPNIPRLCFSLLPKNTQITPRNPQYFYRYHTEGRTVGFATLSLSTFLTS